MLPVEEKLSPNSPAVLAESKALRLKWLSRVDVAAAQHTQDGDALHRGSCTLISCQQTGRRPEPKTPSHRRKSCSYSASSIIGRRCRCILRLRKSPVSDGNDGGAQISRSITHAFRTRTPHLFINRVAKSAYDCPLMVNLACRARKVAIIAFIMSNYGNNGVEVRQVSHVLRDILRESSVSLSIPVVVLSGGKRLPLSRQSRSLRLRLSSSPINESEFYICHVRVLPIRTESISCPSIRLRSWEQANLTGQDHFVSSVICGLLASSMHSARNYRTFAHVCLDTRRGGA